MPNLNTEMNGWMDGWMDRQIDRQIDRSIPTNRQIGRAQIGKQFSPVEVPTSFEA